MARSPKTLVDTLELEVELADDATVTYRTTPVDVWRAEKLTHQAASDELLRTFTGYSAMAWSCAMRAGHAFRQKAETDEQSFERWLGLIVNVRLVTDDEDDKEAADASPLEPASDG
jgi:hypothetical protein